MCIRYPADAFFVLNKKNHRGFARRFFKISDKLNFFESLLHIVNDIVCIFDTDGKTDQVRTDACFHELFIGQLTVSVACRVEHAATCIGYVGHDSDELESVHELDGFVTTALDTEGHNAARNSTLELLLGKSVIRIAFETGEVHPGDLRMVFEELGDLQSVFTVLRHAKSESFKTRVQKECVLRSLDAAEVAHELCSRLHNVTLLAESLTVSETMVRRIRFGHARELVVMGFPVEVAAIDDSAADGHCMSIHIFGRRMGDDICAELERLAEDRRCECIVDDERNAVLVSDVCELLDVRDVAGRVRNRFTEESLGVRAESLADFFFACVRVDEGDFNAELLHGDGKKVVGTAVNCGRTDEVIAAFADVENGEEVCSLTRAGEHTGDTAFEFRNLGRDEIVRRVLETGVEVAVCLEVEQVGHLIARVVLESGALINRENARFTFLRLPTALDAYGLIVKILHGLNSFLH